MSLQIKSKKDMEDILPTEFELAQNFPNPFKEITIIKYCVPEEVKIKLEVFDSGGNKIITLIDEIKEAGTYQVELKTNGMKEGIYSYRLTAGSYESIKRMLVLK